MSTDTPTSTDPQFNDRAQHLFKALVESYIHTGQPVGSRTLARAVDLGLSPATIRNVMSDLEDMGFIKSPHTSAGRIPTVEGYRVFVDNMLKVQPLSVRMIAKLKKRLGEDMNNQELLETASTMLSAVTQMAGVVTVPRQGHSALQCIEFLPLTERRILAVMVMSHNDVQNRIIYLDRDYTRDELQRAANYLNEQFGGLAPNAIRKRLLAELDRVRKDMNQMMIDAIQLGEKLFTGEKKNEDDYILAGQTNLMDFTELSDVSKLRQLFEAFNRKRDILHLLDKCISAQGVQIFIGEESGYQVLDDCSVVSAPYRSDDGVIGVLGVIGPTRMAYDRVVPIVDITARLLGETLNTRN